MIKRNIVLTDYPMKIKLKIKIEKISLAHFLSLISIMVATSLAMLSGINSNNTKLEEESLYISNVVRKDTSNGERAGILIGKTQKSGQLPNAEQEFLNTYGLFTQQQAMFGSGFNFNKDKAVLFSSISGDNYSVFCHGACSSTEYYGHYKHLNYPFEFMFPFLKFQEYEVVSKYVVSVSQTQADILLKNSGRELTDGKYTQEDYESLILNPIYSSVDGESIKCVIGNIYLEINNYFRAFKEILGNFLLCSYYFADGLIEKENLYFLSKYEYQIKYMITYINTVHSNKQFELRVCNGNFINKIDAVKMLSFYYSTEGHLNYLFWIMILSSAVFIYLSLAFLHFLKSKRSPFFDVLFLIALFIPYLIFFIIFQFTGRVTLFSNDGIIAYSIIALIALVLHFAHELYLRKKRRISKDNYYAEVEI